MNAERLSQLADQAESIARRARQAPVDRATAEALFTEALRSGAPVEDVERFRVECVARYEASLDLIVEAAANQRAIAEETGLGPQ